MPRPITRLILDLTTPAERLVRVPVALGLVGAAIVLAVWWEGGVSAAAAALPIVACTAMVVAGARMIRATSCYYILDEGLRQVLYHQKILGHLRVAPWLGFDDVDRLELASRQNWRSASEERGPGRWYWSYQLFLVDRRGRRTPVSDTADSDEEGAGLRVESLESLGWQASALLGRPFVLREPVRRTWGLAVIALAILAAMMGLVAAFLGLPVMIVAATTFATVGLFACVWYGVERLGHLAARGEELPAQSGPSERLRTAGGQPVPELPPARGQ